eukprot:11499017-Alexandrium_andersonii.AAC.1
MRALGHQGRAPACPESRPRTRTRPSSCEQFGGCRGHSLVAAKPHAKAGHRFACTTGTQWISVTALTCGLAILMKDRHSGQEHGA